MSSENDKAHRTLNTRRTVLLGLAGSALLSVPHRARAEDEWGKIVAGAKREGHVVVYSAFVGFAAHQDLKKEMAANFGITVDILEARASEVRERIRVEHTAGRYAADVSENGRTTTTLQIKEDKVFDPFGPLPALGNLKPEFHSDGMRLPVFAIIYGILANTQLVKPADEPKSWADLADPRWKGKILSDDFRALGGGGVLFSVLEDHFGQDFHKKLAQQDIKFSREIPANERRIARGEYPLYIPDSLTAAPTLKGLPVKFLAPKEGLPYIGYDLALVKNAPHPNAARVLMNYYLGKQMQGAFARLGLLPVTTEALTGIDPDIANMQKSKLLGTTDPARMNQMLDLAKQIYR